MTKESKHKPPQIIVFETDTVVFVGILFDRLYVLRNQLVHGGVTWNS